MLGEHALVGTKHGERSAALFREQLPDMVYSCLLNIFAPCMYMCMILMIVSE